jgi:phosphate transport system protein
MDTHFQKELTQLKENLLEMATLVEGTIRDAISALMNRDSEMIKKTMEKEDKINAMENAIDEMCLKLLALRQPLAADLRFITSAMKIVTDLERMGDLAVNIV